MVMLATDDSGSRLPTSRLYRHLSVELVYGLRLRTDGDDLSLYQLLSLSQLLRRKAV